MVSIFKSFLMGVFCIGSIDHQYFFFSFCMVHVRLCFFFITTRGVFHATPQRPARVRGKSICLSITFAYTYRAGGVVGSANNMRAQPFTRRHLAGAALCAARANALP